MKPVAKPAPRPLPAGVESAHRSATPPAGNALFDRLARARTAARVDQRRADIVLDVIKQAIADGALAAGDRLPTEFELAAALGISRTPVREAMRVMATIGLVDIVPGSGTFVRGTIADSLTELVLFQTHLKTASVHSLSEVRRIFERACAELAAERATAADLAAMRDAIERLDDLRQLPDAPNHATVEADLDFHRAVYAASHNELVTTLAAFVLQMLRPWIVETQQRAGCEVSVQLHRSEYELIAQGRGAQIRATAVSAAAVSAAASAADRGMDQWLAALQPDDATVPAAAAASRSRPAGKTTAAAVDLKAGRPGPMRRTTHSERSR